MGKVVVEVEAVREGGREGRSLRRRMEPSLMAVGTAKSAATARGVEDGLYMNGGGSICLLA